MAAPRREGGAEGGGVPHGGEKHKVVCSILDFPLTLTQQLGDVARA